MKYVEIRSSLVRSDALEANSLGVCGGFIFWSAWPPIESRFCTYVGVFGQTQN